jgi:hypothetical protein
MEIKLEFKQWYKSVLSEVIANQENNFLNILKNAFNLGGIGNPSELRKQPLRNIETQEVPGYKGTTTRMGVKNTIKNLQFYKDLPDSDPRKKQLDNIDEIDGTVGDIVDIMVSGT